MLLRDFLEGKAISGTHDRILADAISCITVTYRTLRDNNEKSSHTCLVREIDLQKLPKGGALDLCHQTVTPLTWCDSSNIIKIIHREILTENDADQPGQCSQGARALIITDFFYESIYSLVS